MKCIDEEIPFEIPQSWGWARMGAIGDWGSGSTPSRGNPSYYGGHIPWLKTGELNDGIVYNTEEKITEKALKECSLRLNSIGDVLIAMYGATIGKVAIAGTPMTTNQACCGCTPIFINNEYLFYFLLASKADFIKKGEGGAQPNISREKLVSHLMPIAPLNEQGKIIRVLKHIFPNIDKYKKTQIILGELNSRIKEQLKKSVLQYAIQGKLVPQIPDDPSAVQLLEQISDEKVRLLKDGKLKKKDINNSTIYRGDDNKYYEQIGTKIIDITDSIPFDIPSSWSWCRLSQIANIYTGNSINETDKKKYFTGVSGCEYIATKDVGFDGKICYKNGVAIPDDYMDNFRIAPSGSVLMCIEGGSAGRKIGMLEQSVCFGNKLCCFAPYGDIAQYIMYYLQSPTFLEIFNSNKNGIIGGVSVNNLKQFIIPLPPFCEIKRIEKCVNQLIKSIEV